MPDDNKYPYGYQLSFLERLRLRLKKTNYWLSFGLSTAFLVFWYISQMRVGFLQGTGLITWQKIWGSLAFLLLSLEGLIWMITGEMKRSANMTYRGKSVVVWGTGMLLFCWSIIFYIVLN